MKADHPLLSPAFRLSLKRVPPLGSLLKARREKRCSPRLAPTGRSLGSALGATAPAPRLARPVADCEAGDSIGSLEEGWTRGGEGDPGCRLLPLWHLQRETL